MPAPAPSTTGYDPAIRLYQTISGATTLRFAYDGLNRIAEHNGSNALQRRYVHGPKVDEPLVWYEGSGTADRRFLSSDERGSIVSMTDSSGTVLGLNKYDEYGDPQAGNLGAFGYTGQVWMQTMGIWYYKARVYDPELGRFLQTDPSGTAGGINLYAYVGNDPLTRSDVDGERWLTNGERAMVSKYFGPGLLDYIGRTQSKTFGFLVGQPWEFGLDLGRSHIVPAGIRFSHHDWRHDYSTFDSIAGDIKGVFLHELYHHFEIAVGISTFREMLGDQVGSWVTGEDLYNYDTTKSFLDNTPEARAYAFERCVTYSNCSDIGNQIIPIDALTGYKITPSGITFYAIVTGSRIPRPVSYPIKIK